MSVSSQPWTEKMTIITKLKSYISHNATGTSWKKSNYSCSIIKKRDVCMWETHANYGPLHEPVSLASKNATLRLMLGLDFSLQLLPGWVREAFKDRWEIQMYLIKRGIMNSTQLAFRSICSEQIKLYRQKLSW